MATSLFNLSQNTSVEIFDSRAVISSRDPVSNDVTRVRLSADEADALRLWLDDHVQTKNVLV